MLLFDLDGTLTDPRAGMVRCMRHALDTLGSPCPSDDVLASFIGPPIRGTFGTLLATSDRELIERATSLYREQYGVSGLFENRVYDGVAEMLDRVGPMAAATFVATLKPKPYADPSCSVSVWTDTSRECTERRSKNGSARRWRCSPICSRRNGSRRRTPP